jgi:membrane protein YqaA with SNARE-associated domain
MESITAFLVQYGCVGMFFAAFLSASIFPFSSEVVMAALQTAGVDPVQLIIWGTLGNVGGSMFNYWIGHFGRMEWIETYLHIKREKVEKWKRFVARYGAWMGFFAFVPVIGDVITVALGFMRANPYISALSIFIGKLLRYIILVYVVSLV